MSDELEKLDSEPAELWIEIHPGSVLILQPSGWFDCASAEVGCVLVAEQETDDFENGEWAVEPRVGVQYVEYLGHAAAEAA